MQVNWIIMLISLWTFCSGMNEFYSSTDHMTRLISIKQDLSEGIGEYVAVLEKQMFLLRRALLGLDRISNHSSEDPEKFVSNPLTAYKLISQLRRAGDALEEIIRRNISQDLSAVESKSQVLPADADLDGVALAMIRLQELYQVDLKTMSGFESSLALDPDETFHIGQVAQQNRRFRSAALWLQETLRKLDEDAGSLLTKHQVQQLLDSVSVQTENKPLPLGINQSLLTRDVEALLQMFDADGVSELMEELERADLSAVINQKFSEYQTLCRAAGGTQPTPLRAKKLSCRYTTGGGNPRLIYAPAKEEEEWDQPLILRYHNLLSEREMNLIKQLSRPKLDRAKVSDPVSGEKISTMVRVSKSAWLSEGESPVVARTNQKIADITGLDLETAEDLQVANYGIGGQYEPHYDSAVNNDSYFQLRGGRIATVLIYMSDVEVGGATVFPNVGAALQPEKGSAVVWFNLLKNGSEDSRTLHAACPVFIGSKWVANKWIHIRGQEFRRRCSLSRSD
ncbi:prolyl 4-hydroxylase subunit alpha-1-like [Astyanax mexicanus]|uniref:procollagen-proline 4-dioxygenase n=1 Tax=Astyanax mexicanus TaxID=7994 RepID=A0A8T2L0P5_ASTMX|nr:prolyl 4-hydroxylase subunit alpha-1-like [Astyanax mexicanus]